MALYDFKLHNKKTYVTYYVKTARNNIFKKII